MHKSLTYATNGCLFKVHTALGNLWNEDVYEKALESELRSQGLAVQRQKEFEVFYFDKQVGRYRTDLLVEDAVIIELKAVPKLVPLHHAQLISYLKGFDKPLGILANFGGASLEHATYPNKTDQKTPLADHFDFEKIRLKDKDDIKDLIVVAAGFVFDLVQFVNHFGCFGSFFVGLVEGNTTARYSEAFDYDHSAGGQEKIPWNRGFPEHPSKQPLKVGRRDTYAPTE